MSIVGARPETGLRVVVERTAGGPPWRYTGDAVTHERSYPLEAVVHDDGSVDVEAPADAPPGLAEKARLIVRSAHRHARIERGPSSEPPRRISRWRAG